MNRQQLLEEVARKIQTGEITYTAFVNDLRALCNKNKFANQTECFSRVFNNYSKWAKKESVYKDI